VGRNIELFHERNSYYPLDMLVDEVEYYMTA
jgi:hypothetical protein